MELDEAFGTGLGLVFGAAVGMKTLDILKEVGKNSPLKSKKLNCKKGGRK